MKHERDGINRRDLLTTTALAAAGLAMSSISAAERNPLQKPASTPTSNAAQRRRLGALEVSPLGLGCMGGTAFYYPSVPRLQGDALKANMALFNLVRDWSARKGVTQAQFSLAWLLARKPWIVPIPGTTDPHHLAENLGAINVRFTADELRQFNADLSKITIVGDRFSGPAGTEVGVEAPRKGQS